MKLCGECIGGPWDGEMFTGKYEPYPIHSAAGSTGQYMPRTAPGALKAFALGVPARGQWVWYRAPAAPPPKDAA